MAYQRVTQLKEISRRIYYKIPVAFRYFVLPARIALRLLEISRLDVWVFRGKEASSQQDLCIAYAGSGVNRNYIVNLAYNGQYTCSWSGRVWVWKIPEFVKQKIPDADLLVVATHKAVLKWLTGQGFTVPSWVANIADISSASLFACFDSHAKRYAKRMLRDGFSFEVTRSPLLLGEFYRRMYVPYGLARYGQMAALCSYDDIRKVIRKGELLLVKKDSYYLAGQVLTYTKAYARASVVGVLDGDFSYVRQGAITALYYFYLSRFKEKGYRTAHLGLSRPFLKDGVLQHKRGWGGKRVWCEHKIDGYFYIQPLRDAGGLRHFLVNNPFIFLNKKDGTLNGAIFVHSLETFCRGELHQVYRQYYFDGMSNIYVYSFGDDRLAPETILSSDLSNRIKFLSADLLFQKNLKAEQSKLENDILKGGTIGL